MNDNINFITLHKMIFIYNAVKLGWTVRCIDGTKFEFKKNKNLVKQVKLDNHLKKFIEFNMSIQNIKD